MWSPSAKLERWIRGHLLPKPKKEAPVALFVETFIAEEKKELMEEDKAKELRAQAEAAGLTGQIQMLDKSGEVGPIPFVRMDERIRRVIELITPVETKVEEFDKEPIPLAAIAMVMLAKEKQYFPGGIYVTHSFTDPDPFIIGHVKRYYPSEGVYLLARWGPERVPFEILETRARKLFREKTEAQLKENITRAQLDLGNLDALTSQHFGVR